MHKPVQMYGELREDEVAELWSDMEAAERSTKATS